ncbi:VOC family protein [Photobacterium sp. 53610]|uniref:VOC family protein n=1 Tax=Photobacterium sp. 53610 TaxID=3102789 RepID=UPI002ED977A2
MTRRPKPLNGLRHLALAVHPFEECVRFYTEIMGMEVLRKANEHLIYLSCGNDNLSLSRAHENQDNQNQSLDHFGFIVDSKEELQAWYEFLKSQGVPLLDRPHDHSDGARSFHCTDPAGNVVQPLYHPAVSGQRLR